MRCRPRRTFSPSLSSMTVKHHFAETQKYASYIGQDFIVVMIGWAGSPRNAVSVEEFVSNLMRDRCQNRSRKTEKIGRNLDKHFRSCGSKLDLTACPFSQACRLD